MSLGPSKLIREETDMTPINLNDPEKATQETARHALIYVDAMIVKLSEKETP